jgi:hypothetical protein
VVLDVAQPQLLRSHTQGLQWTRGRGALDRGYPDPPGHAFPAPLGKRFPSTFLAKTRSTAVVRNNGT